MITGMQQQERRGNASAGLTEQARGRTTDVAGRATSMVDSASTSLGRGVERVAGAIESAGRSTSSNLRDVGRYLQRSDPSTLKADVVATLGRHPGATLAVGLGMGLALGQLFRTHRTEEH